MDLKSIGMGLAFAFMWSSAFTSARIIVASAPPIMTLSFRFLISGLIALAVARMLGQSFKLSKAQWRATIVFGLCQNAIYLGANFVAMETIEASLAAIIASTMPLLVALGSWVFLKEKIGTLGNLGLVAGMVGVMIIMGTRIDSGADPYGMMLCGMGAVALALATMLVRGATSGGNLLVVVGLQMLVGCVILAVLGLATETYAVEWNTSLVLAFIYTTIVPGLAATWVWFLLVNRIGAIRAATYHFLNPFFGVAVAAILLGERVGVLDFVGVAIIMAGILAVQISRSAQT